MSLYDPLPNGKLIPSFNPVVQPLSPPPKSGPTISSSFSPNQLSIINTSLPLVPVSPLSSDNALVSKDPYKVIPPNPAYEDKQK